MYERLKHVTLLYKNFVFSVTARFIIPYHLFSKRYTKDDGE